MPLFGFSYTPHPSLTDEVIMEAVERSLAGENVGFCVRCGAEADGVEPDAERYICEACGAPEVYGAETLLLRLE